MTEAHEVYQSSRHHMFPHAVSRRLPTAEARVYSQGKELEDAKERRKRAEEEKVKKETAKQSLFCHLVCSSDDVGPAGGTKQRGFPAPPARNVVFAFRSRQGIDSNTVDVVTSTASL
jgi:hypothetical protein